MSLESDCLRMRSSDTLELQFRVSNLEKLTIVHVALFVCFISWAYGGNAGWSRLAGSCWGSLGIALTIAAIRNPEVRRQGRLTALRWLWPFALFNLLVLASCLNPSFREVSDGASTLYVQDHALPYFPSAARPDLTLRALWYFDAVYISCFNLILAIGERRVVRHLLLAVVANAVLLAVFGTVQKLIGAQNLFFLPGKAMQPYFFSSFIYHNHWGAYAIFMIGIGLGLVFRYARDNHSRDFWHSPGFVGLVAVGLLAATVPLSGSRSCTAVVALLLLGVFLHWLVRSLWHKHTSKRSWLMPAITGLVSLIAVGMLAYDLARPIIQERLETTYGQLERVRANPNASTRVRLYRDTWRMALQNPWFGWGMASYPTVFFLHNSQRYPHPNRPDIQLNFRDAHSDWLQSLTEVGFVGTCLLGLCALVPLYHRRRTLFHSVLGSYVLLGGAAVVLYAWLEFPFGNGAVLVTFWLCFFCAIHCSYFSTCDASSPARHLA